MDKIIERLDQKLVKKFPNIHFYGLAELVTKETTTQPVTIGKTVPERTKIAIDDRYDAICYHRLISTNSEVDEDNTYGVKQAKKYTTQLRTIIASKISTGEDFNRKLAKAIPSFLHLSGYDYINFMPSGFDEDHENVVSTEWTEIPYHKHRTAWNVNAIENNVEYLICGNGCSDIYRE
jgi:hypothetical protein